MLVSLTFVSFDRASLMADAIKKESTFIKHKTRISVYDIFVIKFHIIRFMFLQMTSKITSDIDPKFKQETNKSD